MPSTDSRQLLDLVNRLCDATDPVEAANLRNTLLLQLSAQGKLGGNQAVWPDGSRVPDWQNEIRQETAVKLLVRFAADALAFEDRGSYAAAAWLDMVCKNCRADAKQRYRESAAAVGTPRDPRDFERFAARLEAEHLRDVMERGIRGIADPQVQAAMFDYLDGIDIDASAERLGVCSRTVDSWRQQGREELRPFLAAELGRRE